MTAGLVSRKSDLQDHRDGLQIDADWGHVSVLLGGGHISELVSNAHPRINPLWHPQWLTIDPDLYSQENHEKEFGGPPDGRLLAGISGHSLSFDYFGPPSEEECGAGLTTHGEAPAVRWQLLREFSTSNPGFEYGATLPVAQIDFRRTLTINEKRPIIYFEEKARNLSRADRPICWNEHVSIGPPFLDCGVSVVDMPATRSKVISASYSSAMGLVPDACFTWPNAPTPEGGSLNLRMTSDRYYSRYTAQLLDPVREIGYVAIGNPAIGLLLLYLFRRADFPWVGNWEERFYQKAAPWSGKTFCRGLEFSTTPFTGPKRKIISDGPLFDEATYRWLPASSEITVRYLAMLVDIPSDFQGVDRIAIEGGSATIFELQEQRTFPILVDDTFLTGAFSSKQ